MTVTLEIVEQDKIVKTADIEVADDESIETVIVRLAATVDLDAAELLEDLTVDGERIHAHHKLREHAHRGRRWRHHHRRIRVIVFSPRTPDPKEFFWRRNMLVGEAAKIAANAFGYVGGNPGLQTDTTPPKVLDNRKTLEAEHVHCGEKLEILDSGGGVYGSCR